jgi:hypothetical protein
MSELSGRDLLEEWRKVMESVISSASSAAGRTDLPRDLLAATQRQIEMVQEVFERERRLQIDLTGRVLAPIDAVFDLLEETGSTLRRQAEALQAAGRALEETAELMAGQAEMFERTVGTLRVPADIAKAAAGTGRRPKKSTTSKKNAS